MEDEIIIQMAGAYRRGVADTIEFFRKAFIQFDKDDMGWVDREMDHKAYMYQVEIGMAAKDKK